MSVALLAAVSSARRRSIFCASGGAAEAGNKKSAAAIEMAGAAGNLGAPTLVLLHRLEDEVERQEG